MLFTTSVSFRRYPWADLFFTCSHLQRSLRRHEFKRCLTRGSSFSGGKNVADSFLIRFTFVATFHGSPGSDHDLILWDRLIKWHKNVWRQMAPAFFQISNVQQPLLAVHKLRSVPGNSPPSCDAVSTFPNFSLKPLPILVDNVSASTQSWVQIQCAGTCCPSFIISVISSILCWSTAFLSQIVLLQAYHRSWILLKSACILKKYPGSRTNVYILELV